MKNGSTGTSAAPSAFGEATLQKALLLLLVGIALTFILFSHGAVIGGKPSVGSVAKKDVRSDRDLIVLDRSATEQKKAEIAAAGPVFDYDETLFSQQMAMLTPAFTAAEKALRLIDLETSTFPGFPTGRSDALRTIRSDFEAALGFQLTEREFEILRKHRFSSDLLNAVSALLQAVNKLHLVSRSDIASVEKAREIVVRNTKTYQEIRLSNIYSLVPLEDLPLFLRKNAAAIAGPVPEDVRELAVSIVGRVARPNTTFNREATEIRKQNLLDQMKPVYYKILKNEVIVREGQPITPRTVDEIEALNQAHGGGNVSGGALFLGIFSTVCLMIFVFYRTSGGRPRKAETVLVDLIFLGALLIVQMLIVRVGIFLAEAVHQMFPTIALDALYYAIPFSVGPVLAAVFLNRNTAFVFSVFSSVLIMFFFEDKIALFLLSFLGSVVSVHQVVSLTQRSAFYRAGIFAGLINSAVVASFGLFSGQLLNADMLFKLAGGLSGGILSGVIVSGIAPFLESLFGYTTNIKLLELANLNQPLLQRMIVESPGTYHHSIVVASLVEAAAEAIQANSLLAKVSAYYHDIGKLKKPLYFIENQQNWKNKHDKLSPKMSSLVIISHVKDGCDLARLHKLGRTISDIIRQHHGTGIVGYFYEKAQKDKDPSIRSIPESDFRYPGPRPQSKEAGLVLLGDVIEASSRTLTDPTPSRIRNLVQTRIRQIYADGQLDECELTLRDLNKIAEVFERTLNAIFHQRVDYPDACNRETNGRKGSNGLYDFKPPEKVRTRH